MPATPSHSHRPASAILAVAPAHQSLEERWEALERKGEQIAALADLKPQVSNEGSNQIADLLTHADERAATAALRGLEDMEMLVAVGLQAILEVQARHQDVQAPALALWRELYHAREAVLSVLEPVPV
ncbi:hypothetical protein INR77_01290 [Erythrobacter sp. SCSIO 43205]|uniref:hypothetical protein n=1 Tax=Erythrobacter sp. SCSIO 43205 TaxID=2779361 RepID=UPI001CA803A7|nr:hypothetical protein [Erythrobacter sp. SCSIO 43205]UAB78409.1 hypothetical protein INR77_01290 [Erythrobacter sp. SCSIO 43205]